MVTNLGLGFHESRLNSLAFGLYFLSYLLYDKTGRRLVKMVIMIMNCIVSS